MLMTTMCASAPDVELPQALHDPACVYLEYRKAVAQRDADAVFGALTERAGRSLHESNEFRDLFELWCESQDEPVVVVARRLMGDRAVVDLRSPTALIRVKLEWNGERWLVASDQYTPLRGGKGW